MGLLGFSLSDIWILEGLGVCRKHEACIYFFSFGLNLTPCLMRFQRWVSALTKRSRCTAIAVPIITPTGLGGGEYCPRMGRSPERGNKIVAILKGWGSVTDKRLYPSGGVGGIRQQMRFRLSRTNKPPNGKVPVYLRICFLQHRTLIMSGVRRDG